MTTTVITVEELAQRWNVSPKTIRGMIERKELVALRVGRVLRISRSHVENLERGKHGGVSAG
jgi:excisionase family DNA binding protein